MTYSILTPITLIIALLYIAIILIDAFVIWMFTAKSGVSFWKSLLGAFLGDLLIAVFGFFIGFNSNNKLNLLWFVIAFIISIFVKWAIYIPVFKKNEVSAKRLLVISLVSSFIVYIVLAFLLFYKTGILTQYFDIPYIQVG